MIYLTIIIVALVVGFVAWLILKKKHIDIIDIPPKPDSTGEINRIKEGLHERKKDIDSMSRNSSIDRLNRIIRKRRDKDSRL